MHFASGALAYII